jgi:2OG-Fe(II) oxygenase superfamily
VWDYWYVPDQYTYFRTPAVNVIPPSLLAEFTSALRAWGRDNLGTDRVTVPWLSFYIEGCRQELHSDVVQGMWSYVYSLTPWEQRVFTGGETLLGADRLLDYWARFNPAKSKEARHLIDRIPAVFNQLCIFDSRLPHGVAVVEGTRDPLQARVALHGWFHNPELTLTGSLDAAVANETLAEISDRWEQDQDRLGPIIGQVTWRISIDPTGEVTDVTLVVENLVRTATQAHDPEELLNATAAHLRDARFPPSGGTSTLLLPLET